jgi:glutamyl-tRNA reductase
VHRLVCLGLSHRTAPVELRERIGSLGLGVERCPAVVEHAVLQTCYRVELYAHLTAGVEDARDELVDALSTRHDVPRELLLDHLYVHAGEDVARHLCRVAPASTRSCSARPRSSARSATRSTGARARARSGPCSICSPGAVSAGRGARSETAIGANPATASSMALALAEGVLGELAHEAPPRRRSRAHRAADAHGRRGPRDRRSDGRNRTTERAEEVAARSARARSLGELERARRRRRRRHATCVGGAGRRAASSPRRCEDARSDRSSSSISRSRRTSSAQRARSTACGSSTSTTSRRARRGDGGTPREVPKVEAIVDEEVESFVRRYRELEVEPLLTELRKNAESIREREVERALRDLGDVEPAVAERVEHLSRSLVTKLLHDPTVRARERAGSGDVDEVADAVRNLFGISAPSDQ